MSVQDTELLNELCRTQAENERIKNAIANFKEKREALDNSQADAFGHQAKKVQRRQHELEEAKQKMYSFLAQ